MKHYLIIGLLMIILLPDAAKAQWTFDIVSVEAYITSMTSKARVYRSRSMFSSL